MTELLQRLKLSDNFRIELNTTGDHFMRRFEQNVDFGNTGTLSNPFEAFSFGVHQYKGKIDGQQFEIRKKKKLFAFRSSLGKATGRYFEQGETLIIEGEITGFSKIFIPVFAFAILVYTTFIALAIFSKSVPIFIIPFVFIHASMLFGIPYILMRGAVQQLKYDLEREFHFIVKD